MSRTDQSNELQNRMAWIEMASEIAPEQTQRSKKLPGKVPSPEALCSLCGHPFLRSESKSFPFCSSRCQQIDLGQWLDEKLGLPVAGQEEQEFHGFDAEEDLE